LAARVVSKSSTDARQRNDNDQNNGNGLWREKRDKKIMASEATNNNKKKRKKRSGKEKRDHGEESLQVSVLLPTRIKQQQLFTASLSPKDTTRAARTFAV